MRSMITHHFHMVKLQPHSLENFNKNKQAFSVGGFVTKIVGQSLKTLLQWIDI